MEPAMITEQSKVVTVETPVTSASISGDGDPSSASNEIQRIQATVTELIGLFQQYRDVIDARVDNIKSELEAHVNDIIDRRLESLQALPNHQSTAGPAPINEQAIAQMIQLVVEREMTLLELKRPLNGDIYRMREELGRVKEDQGRLVDKMRRINQLNCESHQKSLQAIKSIRDLINSRP
jgi:chromosome segregation ATPase